MYMHEIARKAFNVIGSERSALQALQDSGSLTGEELNLLLDVDDAYARAQTMIVEAAESYNLSC